MDLFGSFLGFLIFPKAFLEVGECLRRAARSKWNWGRGRGEGIGLGQEKWAVMAEALLFFTLPGTVLFREDALLITRIWVCFSSQDDKFPQQGTFEACPLVLGPTAYATNLSSPWQRSQCL